MTQKELQEEVAREMGLTTRMSAMLTTAVIEAMKRAMLRQEEVFMRGFGTLKVVTRKATKARDIKAGKVVDVPERLKPKFVPSKMLLKEMNASKDEDFLALG